MNDLGLTNGLRRTTNGQMKRTMAMALVGAGMSGCISVAAPDKPIVINLNIKITQEVVVRLDQEAKELIKSNPGIF
ncbi:MAG: YnbE family lipoprotein [Sphingomonas sp.]|jgi:hypothetical protein